MKVILLKDVKKLGEKGDVVDVAEGYGRNYLVPRGLAKPATKGSLKEVEELQAREGARAQKQLETAQGLGGKLAGKVVEIPAKAGDKGRLFGSVTNKEVADAIEAQYKIKIDRRKIDLADGIKSLGDHPVTIKLHAQVTVEMIVRVFGQ
ncbi:MAG: 50S ribosomal protein L9 [Bacillota bacterium]